MDCGREATLGWHTSAAAACWALFAFLASPWRAWRSACLGLTIFASEKEKRKPRRNWGRDGECEEKRREKKRLEIGARGGGWQWCKKLIGKVGRRGLTCGLVVRGKLEEGERKGSQQCGRLNTVGGSPGAGQQGRKS